VNFVSSWFKTTIMSKDYHYMRHALNLARTGQGRGKVNPSVGCVLVKNGHVIAAARTADGGRPHAETYALSQTNQAKGATAYVTLEPCAHEGETPSCAKELVKAGIVRVVIGCHDPDPRTAGQGIQILRDAGIEVVEGILEREAKTVHAGLLARIQKARPFVTLKTAISLDGKIALGNGESQWITDDLARRYAHIERLKHDAILTGSGTVKTDNPRFTVRLGGEEVEKPVFVLTSSAPPPNSHYRSNLSSPPRGEVAEWNEVGGGDLHATLEHIATQGINTLLIEGGAKITTSFLKSGLVDRLLVFRAPKIIGNDGLAAFGDLGFSDMNTIYNLRCAQTRMLGQDILDIYETCSQD
jgi:diaminohydroxyphosphoribosylaminopyrimidine deaminase/5-amino-6-(5-phosphoribosylamino)uracil reductase